MTVQQQIAAVQRRLWLSRFLAKSAIAFACAFLLFGVVFAAVRLFDLAWPLLPIGGVAAGLGLVVAALWTLATREDALTAGARLDEAAGLRERISTSQFCNESTDAFAAAVIADAENAVRGVRVSRVIAIGAPPQWGWAFVSALFALSPLLIPTGLLKPAEAKAKEENKQAIESTRVAVKNQMDQLRELAEKTPALEGLTPKDEDLDLGGVAKEQSASDIRHEALKKIDRYEDALRQKKNSDRYDSLNDMKKMMRAVKPPSSQDAPTEKLAKALQQGDFQSAKEEVEKLQEQLATLKSDDDKEMVQKIGQQLEELSKQLDKIALDEDLKKQLEQAGLKKEDVEKALERLSKKDLEQLQKKLEEAGLNKEQAEQLAKKLQQKQEAKSMASKLAQSMSGSASQAKAGAAEAASAKLAQASEQLSELEQLEQEVSQLEAAASAAADAKKNLENGCKSCGGSGQQGDKPCAQCGGKGGESGQSTGGMGQDPSQGRGGRAESEEAQVAFKTERQKVHTGKGAIVGQLVFEGEQIPGEATSEISRAVAAAEREASDAIHRDRVPRQYHKAVRNYFSKMNRGAKAEEAESKSSASEGEPKDAEPNED